MLGVWSSQISRDAGETKDVKLHFECGCCSSCRKTRSHIDKEIECNGVICNPLAKIIWNHIYFARIGLNFKSEWV